MTDAELGAIQARLNAVGEIEIERDGRFLFELTGVEGDEPENRWWAGIQTQHGHMPEQDMCELATLFQHSPTDIRALLEEVRRGKDELELERAIKRRNVGGLQETAKLFAERIYELEELVRRFEKMLLDNLCAVDSYTDAARLLSDAAKLLGEEQKEILFRLLRVQPGGEE